MISQQTLYPVAYTRRSWTQKVSSITLNFIFQSVFTFLIKKKAALFSISMNQDYNIHLRKYSKFPDKDKHFSEIRRTKLFNGRWRIVMRAHRSLMQKYFKDLKKNVEEL